MENHHLPNVYVARAEFGRYARAFLNGNYVGIGWLGKTDLSNWQKYTKDGIATLYSQYEPDAGINRKGQNVGQIWRFLDELTIGTFVMTPSENREILLVGTVSGDYYYAPSAADSPYPHRKPVQWFDKTLQRSELSVPLQNTLGSSLTIFKVSQVEEILTKFSIQVPKVSKPAATRQDLVQRVIERMLELSADDFEILITQILSAIGFEARHVGRVGDGGIDVEGVLEVYGFARVDLRVQVKRYANANISRKDINTFRGAVPERSQAAFVTLSDFSKDARDEAIRDGFKRIGLINGAQLVDLLVEHYDDLSDDMKSQLRLRYALMPE